ncbi:MAG: hypothetical protein HN930_02170 [Pelagibacterales bacterium]|nr:hypothetical protein [Pelagibacterales bacterium]
MMLVSRVLTIPCFIVMTACSYYLATGSMAFKSRSIDYLLFASIIWLGLPVVGTTIVWLTGSIYLWTTTAVLMFLCLLFRMKVKILNDEKVALGSLETMALMFFAILVGTSGLQFIFTIVVILILWLLELLNSSKIQKIPFKIWLILISFLIGVTIFLLSPGNFVRAENAIELPFFSNLSRFILFMFGAYFSAGVGSVGSTLWLGLLVILLINPLKDNLGKHKDSFIWLLASLLSFLPFLPLINFAAPRVTFFPIILLAIGIKSLTSFKEEGNKTFTKVIMIIILSLVSVDGFVGWIANKSLSIENINRMQIINKAISEGEKEIVVPYFETIPSRLTFLLTPKQDQEYLNYMAKHYKVTSIIQDGSIGAPKPNSKQSLKNLKKSL